MGKSLNRMELLLGEAAIATLAAKSVVIFGLGGVGSFVAEALARAGLGRIVLIDGDTVSITNINRQLVATYETIGQPKVDVMAARILTINPQAKVETKQEFYLPQEDHYVASLAVDYVVDAIDVIPAKLGIIFEAKAADVSVISCMGTGNKLLPELFRIADIYDTEVCPLAKIIRREVRKKGLPSLPVVYSLEEPLIPRGDENGKRVPGSVSFVPPVAGMLMAGYVVRSLLGIEKER